MNLVYRYSVPAMIAGFVLAAVLVLLGACATLAWGLWRAGGMSPDAAIFVAVGAFFALNAALVTLQCALARRWRAAGSAPLGAAGFLRLVAGESRAFFSLYVLGQVLQPWLAPRNPVRIERGLAPVLFVHGIYCNAGVWRRLLAHLRRKGAANLFSVNLGPPLAGIDDLARKLAQRVDEVCQACAAPRAIIVAHSMGGLVTRAWLVRSAARSRVARIVTIGTPHHGSRLARLAPGTGAAQMVPGSDWLARLVADEARTDSLPLACILSWHDSLVAPQDSARLAGARVLELERLGHFGLLLDATVHRAVAAEIAAARSESPS